jgi:two-component system, OmpR family, phosphate regulon response regulator PhoB
MMNPNSRCILVVDDDVLCRTLIKSVLARAGYQVTTAEEGTSALALSAATKPDLVLLDFMMPGMTGPDVARRMREQPGMRGVTILLLTASDREADIQAGFEAGVDGYLQKPIDRRALLARVDEVLRA